MRLKQAILNCFVDDSVSEKTPSKQSIPIFQTPTQIQVKTQFPTHQAKYNILGIKFFEDRIAK